MTVIWVSVDGSDTTGNGSRTAPYATIEKAIEVFSDGDQIRIMDGTYVPTDSVVVSGMEGSIFAENPEAVYIQPEKTRKHVACLVIMDSPRFAITGINVLQAADSSGNLVGIYAESVDNFLCYTCQVRHFEVPSGNACGIFAVGNGRLEDCVVADFSGAGDITYGIRTIGVKAINCEVMELSGVNAAVGISCLGASASGMVGL